MPTQTGFGYGRSCVPPEPLVRGAAGPVRAGFLIPPSVTRAATRMKGAYTNGRLTSRYIAKAVTVFQIAAGSPNGYSDARNRGLLECWLKSVGPFLCKGATRASAISSR